MFVRLAVAISLIAAAAVPLALASTLPIRTLRASTTVDGASADGASADVVLSATGRVMAFDTTATNLAGGDPNGAVRDVVTIDLVTNARRLLSSGGNGPSFDPTMSANGQRVAFASDASNLVAGDTNGVTDLFVRNGGDPIKLVSGTSANQPANAASSSPDISADGNVVAFASAASNLVPGDTNQVTDIFVRNLATGKLTRVSVGASNKQANGPSSEPAISPDGHWVVFASYASNLVKGDTNKAQDVFVVHLDNGAILRASLSSTGRQQNKAVASPFSQIPDISNGGRFVVFDSDATNLYPADINQHTDVFMRDLKLSRTVLISASTFNVEGNNDSFAPRMTPNGRFVSFQSFATNLAPGDGPREDIFMRDVLQSTTTVVNVTSDGSPRGPELVPQLLQRPAISSTGKTAAFASTVANLTPGDDNGLEDVFVRLMEAPVARITNGPHVSGGRVRLTVAADDPLATSFVCQIDDGTPSKCGPNINVKHNSGRRLRVRAGGLGTLFSDPVSISITNDHKRPTIHVNKPKAGGVKVFTGRASDHSGIKNVQLAVVYLAKDGTCRVLTSPKVFKKIFCYQALLAPFLKASGTKKWRFRLPRRIKSIVFVRARAVDAVGNVSKVKRLTVIAR